MHQRIAVEPRDQRQQIGLRDVVRQPVLERRHAGGLCLLVLAADINFAGGIVTDQHHGKARGQLMLALDAGDLFRDAGAELCGNDFSIDDAGGHFNPSSFDQRTLSATAWPQSAFSTHRRAVLDRH